MTLQWSHVLTNVETSIKGRVRRNGFDYLQWSHVLTNVETADVLGRLRGRQGPSMEPRPHERGNHRRLTLNARLHDATFNGATSSRTWKPQTLPRPHPRADAFNGATSSRTWKPCPSVSPTR